MPQQSTSDAGEKEGGRGGWRRQTTIAHVAFISRRPEKTQNPKPKTTAGFPRLLGCGGVERNRRYVTLHYERLHYEGQNEGQPREQSECQILMRVVHGGCCLIGGG